jgi:hypothetical protein
MSEKTIDEEAVREEHLQEVNEPAHWAYVAAVLAGSTLLMLVLIAWMGGASGS